jgi:hypothetical protein
VPLGWLHKWDKNKPSDVEVRLFRTPARRTAELAAQLLVQRAPQIASQKRNQNHQTSNPLCPANSTGSWLPKQKILIDPVESPNTLSCVQSENTQPASRERKKTIREALLKMNPPR